MGFFFEAQDIIVSENGGIDLSKNNDRPLGIGNFRNGGGLQLGFIRK